jgi:Ca2+/Na+ antiporter
MLYLSLLILNILFAYFIRSDKKYWLLSIPLSLLLFSSFIFWRMHSDRSINKLESEYWKEPKNEYDINKRNNLREARNAAHTLNMTFIYCIELQTFITYILQLLGQRQTNEAVYRWTIFIFGILLVMVFILIVFMGIVPPGGMIG